LAKVPKPARVVLSESAYRRYADIVKAVDPAVSFVVMAGDGSLTNSDGDVIPDQDPQIDVAWATGDLFTEDGPAESFLDLAQSSPSLRWFQSPAAGIDNPLYGSLLARGVRVSNSHVQSVPIAEFVLRAALDHFQDAPQWVEAQKRREWRRRRFREISGTTWLIIGFGAIGTDVARRASAFGCYVIGVRRKPTGQEPADEMIHPDDVEPTLPFADVIVLAAPSAPETFHMVSHSFLEALKPDALLINVGRGALIDEGALLESLARGKPESAVLDVVETEPLPDEHPFWTHPRVVITPHNSALGDGTGMRGAHLFARNLVSFLEDGPLENELTVADVAAAPSHNPRGPNRL
jgi:phosphoglycerate dehydrogenase-like enzyme